MLCPRNPIIFVACCIDGNQSQSVDISGGHGMARRHGHGGSRARDIGRPSRFHLRIVSARPEHEADRVADGYDARGDTGGVAGGGDAWPSPGADQGLDQQACDQVGGPAARHHDGGRGGIYRSAAHSPLPAHRRHHASDRADWCCCTAMDGSRRFRRGTHWEGCARPGAGRLPACHPRSDSHRTVRGSRSSLLRCWTPVSQCARMHKR